MIYSLCVSIFTCLFIKITSHIELGAYPIPAWPYLKLTDCIDNDLFPHMVTFQAIGVRTSTYLFYGEYNTTHNIYKPNFLHNGCLLLHLPPGHACTCTLRTHKYFEGPFTLVTWWVGDGYMEICLTIFCAFPPLSMERKCPCLFISGRMFLH